LTVIAGIVTTATAGRGDDACPERRASATSNVSKGKQKSRVRTRGEPGNITHPHEKNISAFQ